MMRFTIKIVSPVSYWPSPEAPKDKRGRPIDETSQKWFEGLSIWLEIEADGELYSLMELHANMVELANGEKLIEKYNDAIFFCDREGRSNVLCFRNRAKYLLSNKWYESRKENIQATRVIKTAANLIMAEIREQKYDTSIYPSHEDISTNQWIPPGLKTYPEDISTNQWIPPGLKTYPEDISTNQWIPPGLKTLLEILVKNDVKQKSVGQAILYAAKPRSFIPPVLFGLGVEVDHLFVSRWLIGELNCLGFSVSYSEVLRFKQSAVKEDDTSKIFETLQLGTFTQFVGDNVDHNLNTLDGKNTFHGMGILAASTNKDGIQRIHTTHIKRQALDQAKNFSHDKGVKIVPYNPTSKESSLAKIHFLSTGKLMCPDIVKLGPSIDLLWQTSQLFPTCKRPNWSGFRQTFSKGEHPGASRVTLLPIINLRSSDESCIYSTLLYVIDLCNKFDLGTPCITFDQPLWIKSVEIATETSLRILC